MAETVDKAVSRLAQYRPFAHEGKNLQAALRDLVLGVAAEAGGGFSNLAECRDAIETLFELEIEFDELRAVVDELAKTGACERDGGGFQLSAQQQEALEARAAASRATDEKAFQDWEISVRAMEPELTPDDLAALRADLDTWLQHVISRHGVEAALILYPEEPRAHELYRQLDHLGLSFLPTDRSPNVKRIREAAIQLLVQQPTPEQRTYLSNLLNVAYFLTVLSLDPTASHVVQERVQGHRIYLDTNVLYRALGLSKVNEVLSARRVLELTKQLGFQLAVTPWTLNELKESLRRAEQSVKNRALPPRELAELMADATSQEGFITAYWRQYKDKGITPSDFFEFYSALETLLEEDGIDLVDEGILAIDRDEDAIARELPDLERVLVKEKPDPVLRHDVKHRLLVDRLRGAGNLTFANARYWFLTQDSALPRYAAVGADSGQYGVPFCASTSAWTQIVRSLVPRTDDLDQALVDLLASPYMRYRGGVSPRVVQEVVARIDQYEGVSPDLATEVLLNGAVISEIAKIDNPEEKVAKIDNAIIRSAERLHEKVETLSKAEIEQREAARAAEAEALSSKQTVEAAHARIYELERALEERQEAEKHRSEQDQAASEERSRLEDRVATAEKLISEQSGRQKAHARRNEIVRWTTAGTLWFISVAGLAVLLAGGVIEGVWEIVGAFSLGLILACAGIAYVFGWKRAWQVLVGVGVLIGVVAAIQQLADGAVDQPDPSTSSTTED